MRNEDLIKALRICTDYSLSCGKCPLLHDGECKASMKKRAADLIESLLDENKALNERDKVHKELEQALKRKCAAMETVIERLNTLLPEPPSAEEAPETRCTGMFCPMPNGYSAEKCKRKDCPYRSEPFNNADRIRVMMDDEMADFLVLSPEVEFSICRLCKYGNPTPADDRGQCLAPHACDSNARAEAFKKWLKQPYGGSAEQEE